MLALGHHYAPLIDRMIKRTRQVHEGLGSLRHQLKPRGGEGGSDGARQLHLRRRLHAEAVLAVNRVRAAPIALSWPFVAEQIAAIGPACCNSETQLSHEGSGLRHL